MKKVMCACLLAAWLGILAGCGCENGAEADLVFVNHSDAVIVEVVVEFRDRNGGSRNADSSPLRKGDSFGFETGEYPVTIAVYDAPFEKSGQEAMALLTIDKAPGSGGRWFVYACGGDTGLELRADLVRGPGWPP